MQNKSSHLEGKQGLWANVAKNVDVGLLIFLLIFCADKVVLKPVGLMVGIVWAWKNFSWKDIKAAPPFYLLILIPAFTRFLFFNSDFSTGHIVTLGIGCLYWIMAALAFAVLRSRIKANDTSKTEQTLNIFFLLNFGISVVNLLYAMKLSGSLNPYNIDDIAFGNSTGDYIKGVFMAPCFINMFVNAMFGIYYLFRKRYAFSVMAVLIACATSSNFANLVFIPILLICLVAVKDRKAKMTVGAELVLYVIFYTIISPGNLAYLRSSVSAHQRDTMEMRAFSKFYREGALMHYCKVISVLETVEFAEQSVSNFTLGAGMGEFSSQLSVRMSDLAQEKKSRLFQKLPTYISPHFRDNHYQIFAAVYSLPEGYHSIRHFPGSTFNQVMGEYGIVGLLLFLVCYIGFFLKRYKQLNYALIMLLMMCGFLMFDYLFEYLSVMVFFELFWLLNLKQAEGGKHE